MPGFDGNGPIGRGYGRGLGPCGKGYRQRCFGSNLRGRAFGLRQEFTKEDKLKILKAEKDSINEELKAIENEMKNLE